MVALHRGIGPLFIPPAEETPPTATSLYPSGRPLALESLQDSAATVRTTEELSRQNPPSEPFVECVCVCVSVSSRSPQATSVICVTSQGALLERGRRVLCLLVLTT